MTLVPGWRWGTPLTLRTARERGPPWPLNLQCLELRRRVPRQLLYALDALRRQKRGSLRAMA